MPLKQPHYFQRQIRNILAFQNNQKKAFLLERKSWLLFKVISQKEAEQPSGWPHMFKEHSVLCQGPDFHLLTYLLTNFQTKVL